jgi:hypothetical protein
MRNQYFAKYSLILLTGILCFGYIAIAFNNRYDYDDFGLHCLVRDNGIWKSFQILYFSWETPYLTFVPLWLLKWINVVPPYVYNISIFLIGIYSFSLVLKGILKYYSIEMGRGEIVMLSALIIALSYFSCRAIGNISYWVTGQIVYCLFLTCLFFGIHFWLKQKLWVASVFMFLFAHSRINYDAIFIGLYASYFIFLWIKINKIVINWKMQIPFLFFIIGMVLYIIVPGNYHRSNTFIVNSPIKHLSVLLFLQGWTSAFVHLAGTILASWKQLMILPVGVLLGFYFFNQSTVRALITFPFLVKCAIAFIVAYLGQATILLIAIRTPVGYGRIFYFLELLLFVFFLLCGIFAGFKLRLILNDKVIFSLILIKSFLVLFFTGSYFYENYLITLNFAHAYDRRIELLKDLKQKGTTGNVYLSQLPESGVLFFTEIEFQTNDSKDLPSNNADYVRYFQLPFNIFLSK